MLSGEGLLGLIMPLCPQDAMLNAIKGFGFTGHQLMFRWDGQWPDPRKTLYFKDYISVLPQSRRLFYVSMLINRYQWSKYYSRDLSNYKYAWTCKNLINHQTTRTYHNSISNSNLLINLKYQKIQQNTMLTNLLKN